MSKLHAVNVTTGGHPSPRKMPRKRPKYHVGEEIHKFPVSAKLLDVELAGLERSEDGRRCQHRRQR